MRAKRTGQGAVRVNQFERSLMAFNLELSNKLAVALAAYHERKVEPLERRAGGRGKPRGPPGGPPLPLPRGA